MDTLQFSFTIYKVQNLANGGYRVALDVPSIHAQEAALLLMYADTTGVTGKAEITLEKENDKEDW